ncbi:uroporphyrinogen-III C-methyltransferase [Allopusillimonas ginsengisoli]|uniref:uroporphyrinogen-III C-methyltransferase n=1 Tax=Allopusillimonas ginsengisoli TaxID=453575 RepID=UPI001020D982|nr:uroporphyrinogen-III C-methyltransferase [Allopusillimonas ginsengisoli]TEA76970.1 uroporphyrinogen-III C-methyltransferase [Allopusillimonas ginsengisoli]
MKATPPYRPAAGKVWLVGAGPGDPEQLTLKALRILAASTLWLVDDLVGEGVLALASPGTRMIKVGKRGGCKSTPQTFILRLMARYARHGYTVARVKGGDPFIFGRGGEEIAWLQSQGIDVDSVSGITAGLAAGSALGLPLTHREVARGVAFVTAHTANGDQPAWHALAKSGMTIVCYMGMRHLASLTDEWLQAGFAPTLPVAIVQRVSCADQRHAITTLAQLADTAQAHGLGSPAVIVLGAAVAHAACAALSCTLSATAAQSDDIAI